MRRCAATLVLAVLACNAGDRDEGPLSGSAGLSAGESATTGGLTTGISGADASESAPSSGMDDTPGTSAAESDEASASDSSTGEAATSESGDASTEDTSGSTTDASSDSSSGGDLADGILDVTITAHDDCTFTVNPASITVPEGTEFTVNWISSGSSEIEFDIAKIDDFNQVPIILGMEPGTSYHDEVREWCGDLFTGTFDFRLTSCFDDHYIPVDCGG